MNLKNIIATLQKLRDEHCNQLDASTLSELDNVLEELRVADKKDASLSVLTEVSRGRILLLIEKVVSLITNITDWM